MWAILKIDNNYKNLFKNDFKKSIGSEIELYSPKYLIQNFKRNKLKFKEINLLGNYVFCFHKNFKSTNIFNQIKYFKGFNSIVPGYIETQKEIIQFINNCKKSENSSGYVQNNFFDLNIENNYKLKTGVFTNKVFEILKFNKNKIEIMIGNLKVSAKKKDLLAQPV
tara:strand:+ start:55 stop:552 length:498 start_codon:yes stop_codon:yes gene_type:complete